MINDLKTSYPAVAVKDDRVIIRSNAESGTAPKLQAFNPADPFGLVARKAKGEKVGVNIPAEESQPTCQIAQVVNSVDTVPTVLTASETAWPKAPPPKTKIETVIEYLKEHGKTDTHTLRGVLRINGKSAHPLSYLQDALSDGRIERDGNLWWAPGCEHVKAAAVAENPPIVADAKPEVQTTILDDDEYHGYLNMPRQAVEEAREALKEERKAKAFTCALWSDGELQLVRDGNTVATLTPEEAEHLSKYLKRTEAA
jgi:hypothetical protein